MKQILVVPHGGRWAVKHGPDAMPIAEYETQQLAEAVARDLAGQSGAELVVQPGADPDAGANRDPHVEGREPSAAAPDGPDRRTGSEGGIESGREPQAGM